MSLFTHNCFKSVMNLNKEKGNLPLSCLQLICCRQQQNEIEKQYEISEDQEAQMEALKEECAVLKRELESLRHVTVSSPRKTSLNEEEVYDPADWSKKLEEISAGHLAVCMLSDHHVTLTRSLILFVNDMIRRLIPWTKLCHLSF